MIYSIIFKQGDVMRDYFKEYAEKDLSTLYKSFANVRKNNSGESIDYHKFAEKDDPEATKEFLKLVDVALSK
jgi:hypothetical protein